MRLERPRLQFMIMSSSPFGTVPEGLFFFDHPSLPRPGHDFFE